MPRSILNTPKKSFVKANTQTGTSYTILSSDYSSLITFNNASSVGVSLSAFFAQWYTYVENIGTGTVTITGSGCTIDGASNLTLGTNNGCLLVSDGTNYFTMRGIGNTSRPVMSEYTFCGGL